MNKIKTKTLLDNLVLKIMEIIEKDKSGQINIQININERGIANLYITLPRIDLNKSSKDLTN